MKRKTADKTILCLSTVALWSRICKFFGFKSDSDGYTKGNTEGKEIRRKALCIFSSIENISL